MQKIESEYNTGHTLRSGITQGWIYSKLCAFEEEKKQVEANNRSEQFCKDRPGTVVSTVISLHVPTHIELFFAGKNCKTKFY